MGSFSPFLAENTGCLCWGMPDEEGLRTPMLPTSPAPHLVVCLQRKQQLGPNTRLRDVLTGAVWKVTATTTEVFEDQTVCVPHSYLWPRRPPPPTRPGSELETEQNSEHCGYPPASPEPTPDPASPELSPPSQLILSQTSQPTQPVYASPILQTQVTHPIPLALPN